MKCRHDLWSQMDYFNCLPRHGFSWKQNFPGLPQVLLPSHIVYLWGTHRHLTGKRKRPTDIITMCLVLCLTYWIFHFISFSKKSSNIHGAKNELHSANTPGTASVRLCIFSSPLSPSSFLPGPHLWFSFLNSLVPGIKSSLFSSFHFQGVAAVSDVPKTPVGVHC